MDNVFVIDDSFAPNDNDLFNCSRKAKLTLSPLFVSTARERDEIAYRTDLEDSTVFQVALEHCYDALTLINIAKSKAERESIEYLWSRLIYKKRTEEIKNGASRSEHGYKINVIGSPVWDNIPLNACFIEIPPSPRTKEELEMDKKAHEEFKNAWRNIIPSGINHSEKEFKIRTFVEPDFDEQ